MADAICMGELLVDLVPTVTGTDLATAPAFEKAPGGAPANVAAGLGRLGVNSAFLGKVGDDGFGRFLAQALVQAGVDPGLLKFSTRANTPVAFVSLAADGEREFIFYGKLCADFGPDDIDEAAVARTRLLHFGSIGMIRPESRAATRKAVEIAHRHGILVSFDANLRRDLWPDDDSARQAIREGIAQAAIVKLSDDELEFLTGSGDPATGGRSLWHDGLGVLVVTHGSKGCTFLTPQGSDAVSGFTVQPVDTTGAGDAFMAGLLAGILEAPDFPPPIESLRGICRFANATGALATTARGAIPALPTRDRVQRLMGDAPA